MLVYLTQSPTKSVWGAENKSYVNLLPLEKIFEKPPASSITAIDPGRPSEFLATCHALLLLHHRTEHCWEVLVVHPSQQPIKKQLEFCRAIEDKGHSPGCSIRTTAPHYPGGIINSQQQHHAKSEEKEELSSNCYMLSKIMTCKSPTFYFCRGILC